MQHQINNSALCRFSRISCIFALVFVFNYARAQTPMPKIISYQGQITTTTGSLMTGTHHIVATIYTNNYGGHSIWQGAYDAEIKNGIYSIQLGSGKYPFPDISLMDRPLCLGISIDGSDEFKQLTQFASAMYALNVPDGSITLKKLAPDIMQGMGSVNNPTVQNANSAVYWSETGNNSTVAGTNYIGTSDNVDLQIKVNGLRAMQIEPRSTSPNIIGGYSGNNVDIFSDGCVIGGGGESGSENRDTSSFGFIGGGMANQIRNGSPFSTVVGGYKNIVIQSDSGAFIGGGWENQIGDGENPPDADDIFMVLVGGDSNYVKEGLSSLVGGYHNAIYSYKSFLGGGSGNSIGANLSSIAGGESNVIIFATEGRNIHSFIGGGLNNAVCSDAPKSSIAGGESDSIGTFGHITFSDNSFIGGGKLNKIHGEYSALGGGELNTIDTLAYHSFLGSGMGNNVKQPLSVISGGDTNFIDMNRNNTGLADFTVTPGRSVIGGGAYNKISSSWSGIGSGDSNVIADTKLGADHSNIGGGKQDTIRSQYAVISGVMKNLLDTNASYSIIGGGLFNIIRASHNVIVGGDSNIIYKELTFNSSYSFIGGGLKNIVDGGSPYNVICGGMYNHQGGALSFIGGGDSNHVGDVCIWDVLGGGLNNFIGDPLHPYPYDTPYGKNYSFLGGGIYDTVGSSFSALGGGFQNSISVLADYSSLAGGAQNFILDSCAFIGGGSIDSIFANSGVIAGGIHNLIDAIDGKAHSNDNESKFGFIGGGTNNKITRLPLSELGGSYPTNYLMPYFAVISGGSLNRALGHFSTIAGGTLDSALGICSATLGGFGLKAYDWQTVVGQFNDNRLKPLGNVTDFSSVAPPAADDPIFIVGSGTSQDARGTAFEITADGRSRVSKTNGSGGATPGVPIPIPARTGSTYTDNIIYASGEVDFISGVLTVVWDFGVKSITRGTAGGVFVVELNTADSAGTPISLSQAAISVNAEDNTAPTDTSTNCSIAQSSKLGVPAANKFVVRTYNGHGTGGGCSTTDTPFMFIVTGRP